MSSFRSPSKLNNAKSGLHIIFWSLTFAKWLFNFCTQIHLFQKITAFLSDRDCNVIKKKTLYTVFAEISCFFQRGYKEIQSLMEINKMIIFVTTACQNFSVHQYQKSGGKFHRIDNLPSFYFKKMWRKEYITSSLAICPVEHHLRGSNDLQK